MRTERPRQIERGVELFPALTPTLLPATHTNSYALGEREVALVEPATPYEDEQRAWLEWARGIASSGRTIAAILLTHHHADHVGGAAFFARELGAPVWAHEATAARVPSIPVARRLRDGETFTLDGPAPQTWKALHTPGHAPGHLCFHNEASGVVVVGDMVASVGTILIEPKDGDMAEYLAQLDRLAELKATVALPAHGEPIHEPTALFRYYVSHRLAREAKVFAALQRATASANASEMSGRATTGEAESKIENERDQAALPANSATLDQLVPIAYADTPPMIWPIARLSLEAHLIKLELDGRVRREGAGWALAS